MKRFLHMIPAAAFLFCSTPALATTAYTLLSAKSVKAVCTMSSGGTESDPSGVGTATAPVGVDLAGVRFVRIRVCADDSSTITGGASILVWIYDGTGTALNGSGPYWSLYRTCTVNQTGKQCSLVTCDSPFDAVPVAGRGRLTATPAGVTFGGSHLTISLFAIGLDGAGR